MHSIPSLSCGGLLTASYQRRWINGGLFCVGRCSMRLLLTLNGDGRLPLPNAAQDTFAEFLIQANHIPCGNAGTDAGVQTAMRTLGLGVLFLSTALASDPALTIYNQNFAVIREITPLNLRAGPNSVQF